MISSTWVLEMIRYLGAAYFLYLSYKSAKSALSKKSLSVKDISGTKFSLLIKGIVLHISNPKAIFFFGSLYSTAIPKGANISDLVIVVLAVGAQSFIIFLGYAFLFSTPKMVQSYLLLRQWFEAVFAIAFGAASFKILTAKFQ